MLLQDNLNVQQEVQGQSDKKSGLNDMVIGVEVALGGSVQLPCRCGEKGSDNSLKWKNGQGEELMLQGTRVEAIPVMSRKYVLKKEDCSLIVQYAEWSDQGVYTCSYLEPKFKFVPLEEKWIKGIVTRQIKLVIRKTKSVEESKMTKENQGLTTVRTITKGKDLSTTTGLETTKVMHTLTSKIAVTTTLETTTTTPAVVTIVNSKNETRTEKIITTTELPTTKQSVVTSKLDMTTLKSSQEECTTLKFDVEGDSSYNCTESKNNEELLKEIGNELLEFEGTLEEMVEQYRGLQRREVEWRAYGFDAEALNIPDEWASKNLWFQQLTHSIRSVKRIQGPCIVKISAPGTWTGILEAVPEPLIPMCQSYAL
uniref:Ig-like domain-containing protein n=1 Tax=Seriola lalandi dorsalis TaxID=1841481 RepID=A0A3B4XG79_SERLL